MNTSTAEQTPAATNRAATPLRHIMTLLLVLQHVFALAPYVAFATVYALSWRAASFIGYWPRASLDDPKFIVSGDWLYDLLYSSCWLLLIGSSAAPFFVPLIAGFFLFRSPDISARIWSICLVAIFLLGLLLVRSDPGGRFYWFFD